MKHFHKISSILLAFVCALAMASCGSKDNDEPDNFDNQENPTLSWNSAPQHFYVTGCFIEKSPLEYHVLYLDSIYSITTQGMSDKHRRFKETWAQRPQLLYHSQPYTDGLGYYYMTTSVTETEYQGEPSGTRVQSYACITVKDYFGLIAHSQEVAIQNQLISDCDRNDTNGHMLTILIAGDFDTGYEAFKTTEYLNIYDLSSKYYKNGRSYNNPYAENNGSGGSGGGTQDSSWEKTIRAEYHWVGDAYATSGLYDFHHNVTVRYDANSGKYYMYETYFNPESNNGKGLRFDAQKGYNSIRVWGHNYGPDAYGVYHLCECYCRFTID